MLLVPRDFGGVKTGAACGIARIPSTSLGQALRKQREEWGTQFIGRSHEIKGRATRHGAQPDRASPRNRLPTD
jgi:hypothetical protein